MPTKQIRIETEALDRFRAVMGVHLPDATAANAAVKLAAEIPSRELHSTAYGMGWLLDLIVRGALFGDGALPPADAEVKVENGDIVIYGGGRRWGTLRPGTRVTL